MSKRDHYRTVILSDLHLGTPHSKVDEVNHFLKNTRCERLILNGDIIDGWRLRRDGRWTTAHTRCVRLILKKMQKKSTSVVYLRGNHDDVLSRFLPLHFDSLSLAEDFILPTRRGPYLVLHGDVFDSVVKNMLFLAHLGDIGYALLLRFNRFYNRYRAWRGKEYFSLSKVVKARVKSAVSYVSRFEDQVTAFARARNCRGVICGHIHTPADKMIGDIHYLNSGDWVESLTAIVEHFDGRLELIDFSGFLKRHPLPDADFQDDADEPLARPEPDASPAPEPSDAISI